MADDITLNSGTGGDTLAADEIGGVKHQRVKVQHGADGSATDVSTASPMPVDLRTDNLAGNLDVNIAAQTADITVADGGNSITVDNADITTIAGAVTGTEMQVDIVAALPAGTNAIGKLAANSGVDIGDVDVLSVTPGTAAGNLGKAEDAVHSTGDVGVQMLAVRKDTATALAGTDGDYAPLEVDASGRLHAIVTNAGTFSVQLAGGGLTALQLIDDIVQTDDTSTHTSGTTRGALFMAAATPTDTSVNANDLGAVAMSTDRRLHVDSQIVGQDADVTIADGGNSITVDASELTTLAGAVTGTEMQVDVVAALPAGSNSIGTVVPAGGEADDAAASTNPVAVAGYAIETDGTDPGTVNAEGDVSRVRTDRQRNLLVNQTHPYNWSASVDYAGAQTNATVKAAPGAGLKLYVTDVIVSNGATAGNITLLDGSGGTVLLEAYTAINGGLTHSFRNPLRLTANTLLAITSTTVTTHSVTVAGYTAP